MGRVETLDVALALSEADQHLRRYDDLVRMSVLEPSRLAALLTHRGDWWARHFTLSGNDSDATRATDDYRQALALTTRGSNVWCHAAIHLGNILDSRYTSQRCASYLDEAIDVYRTVTNAVEPSTRAWALTHVNMSNLLRRRYEAARGTADLDASINAAETGLHAIGCDATIAMLGHANLGAAVYERFRRTSDPDDLDQSIAQHTLALDSTERGSADWIKWSNNLAVALSSRFKLAGTTHDLDAAVALQRAALTHAAVMSPMWFKISHELGDALADRYAALGALQDASDALAAYITVSSAAPEGSDAWVRALHHLAFLLHDRYLSTRTPADLEEAIAACDMVLAVAPHVTTMILKAVVLRERFQFSSRYADLEQALHLYRQVLKASPRESAEWAGALGNYATVLCWQRLLTHAAAPFDPSIALWRIVLARHAHGSDEWLTARANLASLLGNRFDDTHDSADVDEAIVACRDVTATPTLDRSLVFVFGVLATRLTARYHSTNNDSDRSEAIVALRRGIAALDDPHFNTTRFRLTLDLARMYTDSAMWSEAAAIYACSVEAFSELYAAALPAHRLHHVSEQESLFRLAAYAHARAGQLEEAVTLLERGRARDYADALRHERRRFQLLEQLRPDLVDRYARAASAVADYNSALFVTADDGSRLLTGSRRDQAQAALRQSIADIREVPGFSEFLLEPQWTDIAAAVRSTGERVVYFLVSGYGTVCLVLHTPDACDVVVAAVWIDSFTIDDLRPYARRWRDATVSTDASPSTWRAAIEYVASGLWTELIRHVCEPLRRMAISRFTCVSAGALGILPIHVASTGSQDERRYIADEWTVTYAPSATVQRARRHCANPDHAHFLGVSYSSEMPRATPLSLGDFRIETLLAASWFDSATLLDGRDATSAAVWSELPTATVVHLSCHGVADPFEPGASALLLADGDRLTIAEIVSRDWQHVEFVALSACQSGVGSFVIPDEMLSVAGAFMRSGAATVLYTLWDVPVLSTVLVIERFYRLWCRDGLSPATALGEAQRWMRQTSNRDKALYYESRGAELLASGADEQQCSAAALILQWLCSRDPTANDCAHPYDWAAFCVLS